MGIKSRERLFGATISAAAERAAKARKEADKLACEAWNYRMLATATLPNFHLCLAMPSTQASAILR
jgi:hypothetical protein